MLGAGLHGGIGAPAGAVGEYVAKAVAEPTPIAAAGSKDKPEESEELAVAF